jgi:predicted metal-dependent hydrolase
MDEEQGLMADPRFHEAVAQFNAADWYACHDGFEALWHETQGPMRPVLQGILQIAVAHLHRERGNEHGAMVLMGEGLGRLRGCGDHALGLALTPLRSNAEAGLRRLQAGESLAGLSPPRLDPIGANPASLDQHSQGQPFQAQSSSGPR